MSLSTFWDRVRNIMRNDAGVDGDAQRIQQIVWMLFLKVYDEKESDWELEDEHYLSIIPEHLRWRNWAVNKEADALTGDALLAFLDKDLFPALRNLIVTPDTPTSKAIVKTMFADANQYMKDGVLLRQVINIIDELDLGDYGERHAFGDIYESILRKIQSAGSSGEFYTPRALTDFMAQTIAPQVGERMADFACGTGGFITSWLKELDKQVRTAADRELYNRSIYGIEKKQFPYMLCVTNMLLHGIDTPLIMHANSLTKDVLNYTDDDCFDVVLMNPPYGGSEKDDVMQHFPADMRSSETADLFIVLIMHRLRQGGRAAVILPDGFLFGADRAKLAIKTRLLRDFNLHTIIRLPGSIFAPYTSIATNILFFNRERTEGAAEGFATKETWFYRLDMPEGYKHFNKTNPMLPSHCQPISEWWTDRKEIIFGDGNEKARRFTAQQLLDLGCNLDQCKFPKDEEEVLPPAELLAEYFARRAKLDHEIDTTLSTLQSLLGIDTSEQ